MDPVVIVERVGATMLVTINRPEAMNAVDREVTRLLGEAVEELEHAADLSTLVITGAGGRAFCAGGDLKAIARGESIRVEGRDEWGFAGFVKHFTNKPTIAAVRGVALGGGFEIMLASDLVVAGRGATFGLPDVRNASIAGAGGLVRLPNQIPRKLAMYLILTGERITAEEAANWGLVNVVVDDDHVVEAALGLAAPINQNAPRAVQASKRVACGVVDRKLPLQEQPLWELSASEWSTLVATPDWHEGHVAFAEKRPPAWSSGGGDGSPTLSVDDEAAAGGA